MHQMLLEMKENRSPLQVSKKSAKKDREDFSSLAMCLISWQLASEDYSWLVGRV